MNLLPSGSGWAHELKDDGYRLQIHVRDSRVRLKVEGSAIIDAEVVWLDSYGMSNFEALYSRVNDAQSFRVTPNHIGNLLLRHDASLSKPAMTGMSLSCGCPLGKKSSPSQGKIKSFFKIAVHPAATASAHFWQVNWPYRLWTDGRKRGASKSQFRVRGV
jgi:hypothetical protein